MGNELDIKLQRPLTVLSPLRGWWGSDHLHANHAMGFIRQSLQHGILMQSILARSAPEVL